jgi:hypothetical protein
MATIKLGSLTLGKVALGSSTIGDTRKLNRSNAFKAEAVKNHRSDIIASKFVADYKKPTNQLLKLQF